MFEHMPEYMYAYNVHTEACKGLKWFWIPWVLR